MRNNKTLFATEQYKRKGFLYLLGVSALLHLGFYAYKQWVPPPPLLPFSEVPKALLDSLSFQPPPTLIPKPTPSLPKAYARTIPKTPIGSTQANTPKNPTAYAAVMGINTATARALQSVYGIGPVLSKRIIKYRSYLGGFVHIDQLYEVYGLDTTVVLELQKKFTVLEPPSVKKVAVNHASVYELSRVPFITKSMAQEIVRHRAQHGLFINFDEILNKIEVSKEKIAIIKLYLTF